MWASFKRRITHNITVYLVKHLLKAVHEDELLVLTNKGWYVGGKRIEPETVSQLRAEARDFKRSYLWKMMSRDVRFMAYMRATNKARTPEDMIYSSAMYYDLELLEKFIDRCAEL